MSLEKAPKIEHESFQYQYEPDLSSPATFADQMRASPLNLDYRDHNLNSDFNHDKIVSPVAMVEEAAKKRENRLCRIREYAHARN